MLLAALRFGGKCAINDGGDGGQRQRQTLAVMHTGSDSFGPQPAALMLSYFRLEHLFRKLYFLIFYVTLDMLDFLMLLVLGDLSISGYIKIMFNIRLPRWLTLSITCQTGSLLLRTERKGVLWREKSRKRLILSTATSIQVTL